MVRPAPGNHTSGETMSTLPSPSAPAPNSSNTSKSRNKEMTFLGFSDPWVGLLAVVFILSLASISSAQTATSVSSTSGPVSWDFGPVVAGTVTNVGIQDTCPPGVCDNHDLTISLPAPAATFYQTNTVQLTLKYTWNSTAPTDLDIFAISPNAADHGPGSPDVSSTGPGEEDLTLTDPVDGVWHIRSVASTAPLPVAAHLVATMTVSPRPTTAPPPPPAPGAPAFVNYAAPENIPPSVGSSNAGQHGAGQPSIGVDWNTGKAFIGAGNHTLRVTFNDAVTPATSTWED